MKTNLIEKFLKENNYKYKKNIFSIDIFGYRDKYDINIDLQYGDYLMSKFLDGVYVCEVECKTQNRVISLLSKY